MVRKSNCIKIEIEEEKYDLKYLDEFDDIDNKYYDQDYQDHRDSDSESEGSLNDDDNYEIEIGEFYYLKHTIDNAYILDMKSYIDCDSINNIRHVLNNRWRDGFVVEHESYNVYKILQYCLEEDNFKAFCIIFSYMAAIKYEPFLKRFLEDVLIWGRKGVRYLKYAFEFYKSHIELYGFINSNEFSISVLHDQLDAIGQTDGYLSIKRIIITQFNTEYIEKLITDGKIDKDQVLFFLVNSYETSHGFSKHENYTHLGQVCIFMGADIYKVFYKELGSETTLSFDCLMSQLTLTIPHLIESEEEYSFPFFCKNLYECNIVIRIQCLFRCYSSIKRTEIIRLEPNNLFDPIFSKERKRIMKINDQLFKQ